MSSMSVKAGVKAFSSAPQSVDWKEKTSESVKKELKEHYGENKSLGEVLNNIADPNWVDPAKKMRAVGDNQLDKDAFFQLMIAQIKNQDPTEPMKSHDMAAQLAQFTSVEKMSNIDQTLIEMKAQSAPSAKFQALNFIGKSVSGDTANTYHSINNKTHEFEFNLPQNARDIKIHVKNNDGETIRSYEMKNLKQGRNQVSWNGKTDRGDEVQPGYYRFDIEAKSQSGKKIAVNTSFSGKVTGVNYTSQGPVLLVGNKSVRMNEIRKIVDESIKNNDQNVKNITNQDLNKGKGTVDNKVNVAQGPRPVLKNVAMARAMLEKLKAAK